MNISLRHIACAAALLAATAANATTYNFSYTFSPRYNPMTGGTDSSVITGSFEGTASGNLITGLSNISVFRDGVQFGSGNLYNFGNMPTGGYASGTAVVSFDGLENNFLFSTSSYQWGGGWYSGNVFEVNTVAPTNLGTQAYVQGGDGMSRGDSYSAARWSVTAVPEPSTYAMLLGGLGLVGAIARRRRAV